MVNGDTPYSLVRVESPFPAGLKMYTLWPSIWENDSASKCFLFSSSAAGGHLHIRIYQISEIFYAAATTYHKPTYLYDPLRPTFCKAKAHFYATGFNEMHSCFYSTRCCSWTITTIVWRNIFGYWQDWQILQIPKGRGRDCCSSWQIESCLYFNRESSYHNIRKRPNINQGWNRRAYSSDCSFEVWTLNSPPRSFLLARC